MLKKSISLLSLLLYILPAFSVVTADFTYVSSSGCAPFSFHADRVLTDPSINSVIWRNGQTGQPDIINIDSVTFLYPDPGDYTFTLTVSNGTVTDSKSITIHVYKSPDANFTANNIGCLPLNVTFTETSAPGDAAITQWYWDFKDNTSSAVSNPSKTYSQEGTYSIFLKVTDANGCFDYIDKANYVVVYKQPEIDIKTDKDIACIAPLTVHFNNPDTFPLSLKYKWSFGTGDTSDSIAPIYTYTSNGNYSVTLEVSNNMNCAASVVKSNLISIADIQVDFKLYNHDTLFNENDTLCPGMYTAELLKSSSGYKKWTISGIPGYLEGNSITFRTLTSGIISIKLVASVDSLCSDSITKNYFVENTIAYFEIDSDQSCKYPTVIQTTNQSVNTTSYQWFLDDSLVSTASSPVITINKPATAIDSLAHLPKTHSYWIELKATSPSGCILTEGKLITVTPYVARFIPDILYGCLPLTVRMKDTSYPASAYHKWIWNIGDNEITRNEKNVSHTYYMTGDYQVRLVLYDNNGCSDTSLAVTIKAGDFINTEFTVSPSSICAGDSVTITDITGNSNVDSWTYQSSAAGLQTRCYQSGKIKVATKPTRAGFADVMLTTEFNGCPSNMVKKNALFIKGPVGHFVSQVDCSIPRTFRFDADLYDSPVYSWDFGDGKTAINDTIPLHTYDSSGNFRVILKMDNASTSCHMEDTFFVKARKPHAVFSSADTIYCANVPVAFNADSSTDYSDTCSVKGFEWYFGDSQKYIQTYNPQYTYTFTKSGFVGVTLKVIDVNGCWDSARYVNNIRLYVHQPKPDFIADKLNGCYPVDSFIFSNTSVDSSIISWRWGFNSVWGYDMDSIVKKTFTYNVSNRYNVFLEATDSFGCKNTKELMVSMLKPDPEFNTSKTNACLGSPIIFTRNSPMLDSVIWNLGDGTITRSDISHSYASRGKYTVKLIAYQAQCVDSIKKTAYISIQQASAAFTLSDSVFKCYPDNISFTHIPPPDPVYNGQWDFGDGNKSAVYSAMANHEYIKPGTYNASLFVQTSFGCTNKTTKQIFIDGPYADISVSPTQVCQWEAVSFEMKNPSKIDSFTWYFGDGTISKESAPLHKYKQNGLFSPTLLVYGKNDCHPTLSGTKVNIRELIASFDFPKSNACVFDRLQLANKSTGATRYRWDFGNGYTSIDLDPYVAFQTDGSNTVTLYAFNQYDCKDTIEKSILIYPLPIVSATTTDDSICVGDKTLLVASSNNLVSTINWNPTQNVSDTSAMTTSIMPERTTVYTATISDTNGCINAANVIVNVQQHPSEMVPQEYRIAIGDTIHIDATSEYLSTYLWSPDIYLDYNNRPQVIAKPLESTEYIVNRKDKCFATQNTYTITVVKRFTLDIPSTFTPNGDGVNDIVYAKGFGIKNLVEFNIYNRWGNLIFRSNNIDEGWDGSFNGKIQPSDSYTYFVKVVTYDNDKIMEKQGTITLIR